MEDNIHIHKPQFMHDAYRIFGFLIPSIVFASIIVLFLYNRYTPENVVQQVISVEEEKTTATIGSTEVSLMVSKTFLAQQKGLSGRASLAPNEGMYFPFGSVRKDVRFWMKDMLINLDFIWLLDKKVVYIHTDVPFPSSGTPDINLPLVIPANKEGVDGIIEVNAGFVNEHNIKVGEEVSFQ